MDNSKFPIFDFQNPKSSLQKEYTEFQKRAEKYFKECVNTKLETLDKFKDIDQKINWAYKALINAAANAYIVGMVILPASFEDGDSLFENSNTGMAAMFGIFISALLIRMADIKLHVNAKDEIAELEKIFNTKIEAAPEEDKSKWS